MKIFILLIGIFYSGLVDSCTRSPFTYDSEKIYQLAKQADRVVWVEILDKQVTRPKQDRLESQQSQEASTLEELLALVQASKQRKLGAFYKHRPSISLLFNELHVIKGQSIPISLQSDDTSYNVYRSVRVGQKYILFYKEERLLGAARANNTKRYQALLQVISEPVQFVNDHN